MENFVVLIANIIYLLSSYKIIFSNPQQQCAFCCALKRNLVCTNASKMDITGEIISVPYKEISFI